MFNILVWGTGSSCDKIEKAINKENVRVIAYIDNKEFKTTDKKNDKNIIKPKDIYKFEYDYIFIASQFYNEICNQLLSLGIEEFKIINAEKFLQDLIKLEEIKADKEYTSNKFLKNYYTAMNSCNIDTIITGISYAECGVNLELLKYKAVNIALSGQDIYYDYNIVKNIIESGNCKIKNILIGLCYYSFQYDESLSIGNLRCKYVYEDVLKQIHNYRKKTNKSEKLLQFLEDDRELIDNESIFFLDRKKILKNLQLEHKVDFEKNWNESFEDLEEDKRILLGKELALLNSNKDYPNTVIENKNILEGYLKMLNDKEIKATIIVFPVTKYYSSCFSSRLKDEFYSVINSIKEKYEFTLLDYFYSDEFSLRDFSDSSHLNINGASKFTKIINEKI